MGKVYYSVDGRPTEDLIAFLYTYDINENKMMQEVISKAINYDYNMIADINLFSRSAKVYTSNGFGVDMLPKQEFDYQNAIEHYVSSFVVKQERDHVLQKMSLDNVRKQLKEKDSYEFDIKKVDSSGQHKKSKIRYVNLDKVYGTVLWTDRDITHIVNEEEQKQKELLEQVEELKELNRVKSDYLSTFGTSVRMPLKNILNNLKKIVNVCSHDATKGQLADIKHQLSKISDVINDIMVISNLEMQKVKFSEVQFTLSDLVATVTKNIKKKYLEKKITIECVEQVFHNSCLGDYKAIYKLLYNILDNACKFSGNGSDVQIAVYELPFKGQNEAFYRFVIKDNGCGIDTETMQHVFTPFSIYMNETGCKDSSGLGLSIAKIIVERLGGTISLESEVGAGTTVTIDLHMTFVDDMVKAAVPKPENQDSIQNKRLMLVKQNPLEVLVLRKLLESKGAKVYCADTEKEAVNLLESNYADFFQYIVVDVDKLQSEQKNAVLRQLKTHHKLGSAHLFALCSNADLDEKKALVESGACEVLFKPLRFAGLMNVLQEY